MTKRKKLVICCVLAALLTSVTIIPIFAIDGYDVYTTYPPEDLGITNYDRWHFDGYRKYYIKIDTTTDFTYNVWVRTYEGTTDVTIFPITITVSNSTLTVELDDSISDSYYCNVVCPNINFNINSTYYYIPVYIYFGVLYYYDNMPNNLTYYLSYTTDISIIQKESYNVGYSNGYNNGFDEGLYEGQNIQQYTNLVGYVEQLIGQFTGSSAAQYITPIAIVLVVLFVYFLFIRFLLSLVKAKGIIKTCDIIMIVACIIMLVVMYAPMLDLTIKTEQINTSEETTEASEVVRSSNIYKVTTETGDIYYGPVGTAIVTKSETIEDIYKISEDIETEAIAYEKD